MMQTEGFRSVLHQLIKLHCAWYLNVRDEKVCISDKQKASHKSEIVGNNYGKQIVNVIEQGIAVAFGKDYFSINFSS